MTSLRHDRGMALSGLKAVERRSLSEGVFEQLRGEILSGRLAAGSTLPSERELCAQLGVNRGAVREALKRLEQLRLVAIRQGESTRVLDFRETGGLELLAAMLFREGRLSLTVARSLVELRRALGPDIARLAASRRSRDDLVRLDAAFAALVACGDDDAVALEAASFELWRVLVGASDNLAYQLAFNTLDRVWGAMRSALAPTLLAEVGDRAGYERLVRAVRQKRPKVARDAADELVERGTSAVLALLAGWEKTV
jgi:GntR family transcriptional regulator, transcriptional repressor for pyruvate dehydrogenase complex